MNQEIKDQVVLYVMAKYAERSATGLRKYGTTLDREDLTLDQWINHLLEELMDATLYLSRIKKEIELHYVKGFSDGYREASKAKQNIPKSGTNCEDELNPCILKNGCDGVRCYDCFKKHELNKSE